MPYPFTLGSVLLRTQRTSLPRTFCRHKSITAAIEKGRGSGPDRFAASRPSSRTRTGFRDAQATSTRGEGPERGRSRPSRSKSSLGARRRRWEDEDGHVAPRRKELRKSGGRPDESAVDRRIKDQDSERPSHGRSGAGEGRPSRFEGDADDRRQRRPERTFDRDEDDRRQRRPEKTSGRGERSDDKRSPRTFDRHDRPDDRRPARTLDRNNRSDDRQPARASDRDDRRLPRTDRDDRTAQADRPRRGRDDDTDARPQRTAVRDRAPESLPYTTAASEFIYGYSSVLAAIRANRRQYYKLYVNSRGLNRDILLARAKASNLRHITREVGDQYDRAFDKASSGRPHNGFILEASPLPVPPITELKECSKEEGKFEVVLGPQTKEELAVNGTRTAYRYKTSSWRYPLILYLDGVLDEGNLGAIARSAYLLGVEAIVTPTRQSAPWSHIAVKASAGAAEAIPIFKVSEPADFLGKASRNGWRCYAADAVDPPRGKEADTADETSDIVYTLARSPKRLDPDHSPVAQHPTILMMGAEGTGLKTSLLNIAHYKVGIKHGREVDEVGVDSLNVSVAAGLLCHDMLKRRKVVERDPENVVF
ncbi:23S rRNA (guanosine(2251)-2'-O)-methyltransferase [Ascochyta rabiei]|uniref:rRNA methyltransferase 1, mitochondrial n=1 Tax=Didymella rabiei TaxID=5454 RepID=A0A163FF35_DIDRA|nr:23S rRNA (guanosine(2251)-2'-O)-methyltransferase [Ascochyta rabiei]KZM24322.1 RNA binding [Ascochyta rabiei]UPX15154.1 23S rRNA (guanosine(2251)-2'-O)-methyltransferase [Ascochyta rabiei]